MVYVAFVFGLLCAIGAHANDEHPELESRILGGSTSSARDYPYMASLRTPLNELICGASIIHPSWILTAAHCVYKKPTSSIIIVVGTYKRESGGDRYAVSQITTHKGYNPSKKSDNIALLKTATVMKTNKYVKPVILATYGIPVDTKCELTGWGLKRYPSTELANKLRYIKEYTISVATCKSQLPQFSINDTNICAYRKEGKGACEKDDGGPLVCKDIQHGVLSLYVACARGFPDVYTNVVAYRGWINSISGV